MAQWIYPTDYQVLVNVTAGWTDIAAYIVSDIDANWGQTDNGPLDLVAGTGTMKLTLNNSTGLFLPDGPSVLAGFKKGIDIKLVFTFDGETFTRWKGIISKIAPPAGRWEDFRMQIECVDWMEYAARQPIVNQGVVSNVRGNDVLQSILGLMPLQPAGIDLDTGVNIFSTALDTVKSTTRAFSEFGKVAFSEVGRVYLRKDKTNGETLAFENSQARHGWRPLDQRPKLSADSGFLLKEDGGFLLKEDGGKIILNEADDYTLSDSMAAIKQEHGEDILNYFAVTANPRRLDTSAQVLFQLDEPILMAGGATIYIKGNYADPAGGLPVNGNSMVEPVINTDYKFWQNRDGTGTDYTVNLQITSGYAADGFVHKVVNTGTSTGWITLFNCRGYGIYLYNPVEAVEEDSISQGAHGVMSASMDQKYQVSTAVGAEYARRVVELHRVPRTVIKQLDFVANRSNALMLTFLTVDCGMLVRATNTKYNVDSYFYVEGVKLKVKPGGYIMFSLIVRQAWSLLLGLSMLAVEFGGEATRDGLSYGYLPRLANVSTRTMSAWIYVTSDTTDLQRNFIAGIWSDDAAFGLFADPVNLYIRFIQKYSGAGGGQGIWQTPSSSIALNGWYHVAVVKDLSSDNAPIIYINGVSQTLTVAVAPPAGRTAMTEVNVAFTIGNAKTYSIDWAYPMKGKIKDVRVYKRALTSTEITTLYNSGTPSNSAVTDGLLFQGPAVRTSELSQFTDAVLTDLRLLENIYGAVGKPNDVPIGRTP